MAVVTICPNLDRSVARVVEQLKDASLMLAKNGRNMGCESFA
jgi:hypothetical protein